VLVAPKRIVVGFTSGGIKGLGRQDGHREHTFAPRIN
jgi:hypothetical protein